MQIDGVNLSQRLPSSNAHLGRVMTGYHSPKLYIQRNKPVWKNIYTVAINTHIEHESEKKLDVSITEKET